MVGQWSHEFMLKIQLEVFTFMVELRLIKSLFRVKMSEYTGVYEGSDVSMFYDPMIAKLCSYGKNRKSAIDNMRSALAEFVIDGVSNNIDLLEDIYKNERFVKGDISTNYISEEYPDGFKMQEVESAEHCNIIYAAVIIKWLEATRFANISGKINGRERS